MFIQTYTRTRAHIHIHTQAQDTLTCKKKMLSLLWNFLEDPVWLFQKGITIWIKTKSNLENIYHEWSFEKMGEKNKVTDVKNHLTGKKLCIEKFHPKRNRMSHYIALLLHSPQNAPNFSKQRGKYCTWKLPFGLSDRIPKDRKKKTHSKNSHVKLCARFCIKSRLVRSHEYLPGLWSQGVVVRLHHSSLGFL